jgi:hypothetical protein
VPHLGNHSSIKHVCSFLTSNLLQYPHNSQNLHSTQLVIRGKARDISAQTMSQPQSALLRLPAELRHEIYSYILPDDIHILLQGEKCFMAACVERSNPWHSKWATGHEREPKGRNVDYRKKNAVFARRLQSTWGPHWVCEENVFGLHQNVLDVESEDRSDVQAEYKPDLTLLLACKSM